DLDEGRGLGRGLQIGGANHRRLHLFARAGDDGGGIRRHGRRSGGGRSGRSGRGHGGGGVLDRRRGGEQFAGDADTQFVALDLDLGQVGFLEDFRQLPDQAGVDLVRGFVLDLL